MSESDKKTDVDGIKEYFSNPNENNLPESYATGTARSVYLVNVIKRLFSNKKDFQIIELGSNIGRNLHFLQVAGYSVHGIEGSKTYYDAMDKFFPKVCGKVHLGQIEELLHNDSLMLDRYHLVFTMAVLQHIPPGIEEAVFTGIQKRAAFLLTIEDEHRNGRVHFPRKYDRIFKAYGFRHLRAWSFPPLSNNFVMRLFKRNNQEGAK